jgi:hypothetical protein
MKVTVTTTSTSLYDLLNTQQKEKLIAELSRKSVLRIEPRGGDIFWTNIEDVATTDNAKISDGDIEYLYMSPYEIVGRLNEIKFIASAQTDVILDVCENNNK